MNKRTMIFLSICLVVAQLAICRVNVNHEKQPPGKKKIKSEIKLLEPSGDQPIKSRTPTFKWKFEPKKRLKNITFSIIVKEISKSGDLKKSPKVFERKGIRKNYLPYPAKLKPLDSTKAYAWKVTAFDENNQVLAVSPTGVFAWKICSIIPLFQTQNQSICADTSTQLKALILMFGTNISGPINWTLEHRYNNNIIGTIGPNSTGVWWTYTVSPTELGVHEYTLTATRGSCTKSVTFTVNVYPNLTAIVEEVVPEPCNGLADNRLNLADIPSSLDNSVTWTFQDSLDGTFPPPPLPPYTWGAGNNWKNTGIISPAGCPNNPPGYVFRRYTGAVDLSSLDYTLPPPSNCPNYASVDVKVWCPSDAGNIDLPTSITHNFSDSSHTKICSENILSGISDHYPVIVNLEIENYLGTTISWSSTYLNTSNPPPTITPPINSPSVECNIEYPDEYTFTATVTNGTCPSVEVSKTIQVVDPIKAIVEEIYGVEKVCPHEDAEMKVISEPPSATIPPGTIIEWYYQINCTGPWILAGGGPNVTYHNTNEIGPLGPGGNWESVCWRAELQDPGEVCAPFVTEHWRIDVYQPPCTPVISAPSTKCVGDSVEIELTTNNSIPPNCSSIIGYQWYLDGNPIPPPSTAPPYLVTEPGNYRVEALGPCENTESNLLTIKDCIIKVKFDPVVCCSDGQTPIKIKAIGSSTCGGPYTYQWTGGTTPNTEWLTLNPPPVTTTVYTVTVTDGHGCTANKSIIITACN